MRLLLDTHSFLWFIGGDERLSLTAREFIEDVQNDVFLSVASLWEMAIKVSLGRLRFGPPFEVFISQQMSINHVGLLNITVSHAARVADLPFYHRDPFDRLLIAQALTEGMPIVSLDPAFDAYGVTRLW